MRLMVSPDAAARLRGTYAPLLADGYELVLRVRLEGG